MMVRLGFVLAVFGLTYWCLGAFALLRRRGWAQTVRWLLSAALAVSATGLAPFLH